jgi:arylsulfatase A-like enzyme
MRAVQLVPLAAFLLLAWNAVAFSERPNVVLFLADDMGWADVPWHDSSYKMPNLQRLADEGLKLEAHYVHPMCSPTRAALVTGRYASRFGCTAAQNERVLPFDTVTLASTLKDAGYATAITGKWHLGSNPDWNPNRFGFEHSYGSLAGGCGPYDHRYKQGPYTKTWHRNGTLVEEEGRITDLIAREAVQWIDQRDSRPFFLYVPFTAIHVPIDEPAVWQEKNSHIPDAGQRLRAACATHLDDAVGRVLAALKRKNLLDSTLVVFLCDNGAHPPGDNRGGSYPGTYAPLRVGNNNSPYRGHKTAVYEGGIRTPAIAWWPGHIPRGELHTPLHAVDWFPTLCALAGAKARQDLKWDGANILPLLEKPDTQLPERTLYSAAPGFRAQMVRRGDWKLVVTAARGEQPRTEELFNLASDPGESKNLAHERADVLAEMKRQLDELSSRDKDAVP